MVLVSLKLNMGSLGFSGWHTQIKYLKNFKIIQIDSLLSILSIYEAFLPNLYFFKYVYKFYKKL